MNKHTDELIYKLVDVIAPHLAHGTVRFRALEIAKDVLELLDKEFDEALRKLQDV